VRACVRACVCVCVCVCVGRVILIIKFAARFIAAHSRSYVRLEPQQRAFTRNQRFMRDSRAITSPIRARSARELRDVFTSAFSPSSSLSLFLAVAGEI